MSLIQIPADVIELGKDFVHALSRKGDGGKRITADEAQELLDDAKRIVEHLAAVITAAQAAR